MEWTATEAVSGEGLLDHVANAGLEDDVGDVHVGEDEIDRLLQVVDRGLRALAPSIGTAREFSDQQREACKLGLEVCQVVLQRVKAIGVMHVLAPGVVARS